MALTNDHPDVAALRAFNRLYTNRLGLLNAHLDQSPFTLTEARILYELAHRQETTAAELMRTLQVDRAQLSRTLKRFSDRGLVEKSDHPEGGRRQPISLTPAGRKAFTALEQNTREAIGKLLDTLPSTERKRLIAATSTISEILEDKAGGDLMLRDLKPGDLGWIIHRQTVLYVQEYGWNQEYEALAAGILADFVKSFDPAREAAWIAEIDGRVVGSIFLVAGDKPDVAKLRLLYVEPDARGRGVGAALVAACIERARTVGYHTLVLWTNSVLTSARRIYERAGFTLTEEAPHHSFGKDLVGQTWSLDLGQGVKRKVAGER
ncbi:MULTISPECIES: helix-turn-helix domain-containing GNAT family N-acetyltransferase [Ensifer]|jgi:DNA-binding MarR family transcriptional regulator/N-acetylglutamate synthase-like GNAT family acetyltransferase|uniref:GNAT family N-acetyltransferase n=1 Tax=Ensifer canadensis TaxID=555315 RepID=A0AAW4FLU4_9HYPH|nr:MULTISPECIES: helix-turn-helix domain-containing GNAT family N-acetyltransferase [Ensifer]AHK44768.1 putative N-acetyltransferase [Ensifer adhaerens OV14]MDP9634168.1 DNA-binding MarR family transcriptional regulator/GNAT superfamily N-acetyltransferase [Ensifer adhaerens]KQU74284.1 MarR family transcriptional regulator [Ensifer sp. Root31]KQW58565.1 MarR family transcriptional regulator [Ensifer sp. Root1252]KQW62524.1 MarR family transcriptional regulator [Ensifer sp. Root127]